MGMKNFIILRDATFKVSKIAQDLLVNRVSFDIHRDRF